MKSPDWDSRSLARLMDAELNSQNMKDYCPNGLQVQSTGEIRKLVTGVTANLACIEAAVAMGANALLVHHGLFWKGEDGRLTSFRYERVRRLLEHNIALYAYHLPLDVHPTLGNNAQLAQRIGLTLTGPASSQPLMQLAALTKAATLEEFSATISGALNRPPLFIGPQAKIIKTVAVCTGAAQSLFEDAIHEDVDAFLTGEISEQHVHIARETGVAFIAAGHHATERYGVQALGNWLSERCDIEHVFVDIDSPV